MAGRDAGIEEEEEEEGKVEEEVGSVTLAEEEFSTGSGTGPLEVEVGAAVMEGMMELGVVVEGKGGCEGKGVGKVGRGRGVDTTSENSK